MLSKPGEAPPAAVFVDRSGRRRRIFRAAAVAVGLGWVAVIALVIIGLAIPSAPRTVVAGAPVHRPAAVAAHRAAGAAGAAGAVRSTAQRAVRDAPRPPK